MKKILCLVFVLTLLSCQKDKKQFTENRPVVEKYQSLYGNWVGEFVVEEQDTTEGYHPASRINLVIKKIENNIVFGQSIVAGNSRPLFGKITENNGNYQFVLREPGDHKNDGKFEFTIVQDTLSGKWFAADKNAGVTMCSYVLKKQQFKYNPKLMLPLENEYVDNYSSKSDTITDTIDGEPETYYQETYRVASSVIFVLNASTKKLTEKDLKNLTKLELEIIRNTLFARHGYNFKKKTFRQFFDYVDWYIPLYNDVSGDLTPIEKENVVLLERFEKYATDNYDSFGR